MCAGRYGRPAVAAPQPILQNGGGLARAWGGNVTGIVPHFCNSYMLHCYLFAADEMLAWVLDMNFVYMLNSYSYTD